MSSEEEDDELMDLEKMRGEMMRQAPGDRMQVSAWEDDDTGVEDKFDAEDPEERDFLKAAENGKLEKIIKMLAKNEKLLECRDKDGYTPMHRACYGNQIEVLEHLLKMGARVDSKTNDDWQPLHSACCWNNVECAAILISQGADVNAKSKGNQTPLHLVSSSSQNAPALQLFLLHPDIDPNIVNSSDDTPEKIAKRSGMYHLLFEMIEPCLNDIYGQNLD